MTNPTSLLTSNTFSSSVISVRFGKASANIAVCQGRILRLGQGGLGIQVAVYAILGAQAPSVRTGKDYHMLSHNNDIDGVGDKFIRIYFQSLY